MYLIEKNYFVATFIHTGCDPSTRNSSDLSSNVLKLRETLNKYLLYAVVVS